MTTSNIDNLPFVFTAAQRQYLVTYRDRLANLLMAEDTRVGPHPVGLSLEFFAEANDGSGAELAIISLEVYQGTRVDPIQVFYPVPGQAEVLAVQDANDSQSAHENLTFMRITHPSVTTALH